MREPITAVVLCAGEATRFDGLVKQLLEIDGAPLIQRTLDQCTARKIPTWLITHIEGQYRKAGIETRFVAPHSHRWTCETLYSSRDLWGSDLTLVLLGDVYYTDFCIDLLLEAETMFYTGIAEIWGMAIRQKYYVRIMRTLIEVIKNAEAQGKPARHNQGQLWRLYRLWYGMPYWGDLKVTPGLMFPRAGTTEVVLDDTVDFDVPESYARWQAGLRGRQVWWNPKDPGSSPQKCPWCRWLKLLRCEGGKWFCAARREFFEGFEGCTPDACEKYIG